MDSIYLDHNATTPLDPEVAQAMAEAARRWPGNPASGHQPGREARRALEEARRGIAELLGADLDAARPDRLVLTSGGTEANNLAIFGIARATQRPGHVLLSGIEHSSVIRPAERLLDEGWQVDLLGAGRNGVVRAERLGKLLRHDTRLVCVLLANHETGVIQPIEELAAACSAAGVPLLVDAVQAVGKYPVHFRRLGAATMSVGAHKFHGPAGAGALVIRHGLRIEPAIVGGHQQDGLRGGTESVVLAVGTFAALRLAQANLDAATARMSHLRDRFEQGLLAVLSEARIHGQDAARLPQTSSVAVPGIDAPILFTALDVAGVACSVGSACGSGSSELSPTLLAMGVPRELAASSLRFSLGTTTTEADVDEALARIVRVVRQLKGT
ncbi:MAG: cysteine desulfurase [Pirellulales bacterium]|nr:cysteine desulfurase [Pirellulales bacterium]